MQSFLAFDSVPALRRCIFTQRVIKLYGPEGWVVRNACLGTWWARHEREQGRPGRCDNVTGWAFVTKIYDCKTTRSCTHVACSKPFVHCSYLLLRRCLFYSLLVVLLSGMLCLASISLVECRQMQQNGLLLTLVAYSVFCFVCVNVSQHNGTESWNMGLFCYDWNINCISICNGKSDIARYFCTCKNSVRKLYVKA